MGGWAAFTVSIVLIGLLTAVIGDVASHFGCTVGLKDAVTALSFVALGTSIPGQQLQAQHSSCRYSIRIPDLCFLCSLEPALGCYTISIVSAVSKLSLIA